LLQVKPTVISIRDEPHLVFRATKAIDVGDEILFDYNDRESTLPFLSNCPVCDSTSDNVAAPANDDGSETSILLMLFIMFYY